MPYIDRNGIFEARVNNIGIKEVGKAAIVVFDCEVLRQFDKGEWIDWIANGWLDYTFQTEIWVADMDGVEDTENMTRIAKAIGWNGDFTALLTGGFNGTIVQSGVKGKAGKDGKTYYRGSWIDPQGAPIGRGSAPADPSTVAAIASRFNAIAKACAAEAGIVAPAKPVTVPPPAGPTQPAEPINRTVPARDDVPF